MNFFKKTSKLLKHTYDRITDLNIGLHGAAIAFYAIFSTAPLIIILLWLTSFALGSELGQAEFQHQLYLIVGPEIANSIQSIVEASSQSTSGFWSTCIAVATLLFAATTLLAQVKETLNVIWGVKDPQISSIRYFLWDRFKALLFVGIMTLLFLFGLIFETLLYGMEQFIAPLLGGKEFFIVQLWSGIGNGVLTVMFFIAMFKWLPDLEVRVRDIAVGAVFTALLFIAGKALVGWYLTGATLPPAYKAAGSFVIFLIWIYYNVQIVLVGAAFTREYTLQFGGTVKAYWGAILEDGEDS